VIGDGEVWDRVLGMEVAEKVDSDHFPVVISIEGKGRGGWGEERRRKVRKWEWTEGGKELFREKMERALEGKEEEEKVGWEVVKREVQRILQEGQGNEGREKTRGWWDAECREGKKGVRKELRK